MWASKPATECGAGKGRDPWGWGIWWGGGSGRQNRGFHGGEGKPKARQRGKEGGGDSRPNTPVTLASHQASLPGLELRWGGLWGHRRAWGGWDRSPKSPEPGSQTLPPGGLSWRRRWRCPRCWRPRGAGSKETGSGDHPRGAPHRSPLRTPTPRARSPCPAHSRSARTAAGSMVTTWGIRAAGTGHTHTHRGAGSRGGPGRGQARREAQGGAAGDAASPDLSVRPSVSPSLQPRVRAPAPALQQRRQKRPRQPGLYAAGLGSDVIANAGLVPPLLGSGSPLGSFLPISVAGGQAAALQEAQRAARIVYAHMCTPVLVCVCICAFVYTCVYLYYVLGCLCLCSVCFCVYVCSRTSMHANPPPPLPSTSPHLLGLRLHRASLDTCQLQHSGSAPDLTHWKMPHSSGSLGS